MKTQFNNLIMLSVFTLLAFTIQSCDNLSNNQFEPLGANSIPDATPPSAGFSYAQGAGPGEEWKTYSFANQSSSATTYVWNFENGDSSADVDAEYTYPGEGTYTVTLTASDNLGVVSTISQTFEIIEPAAPLVADPILVNADFDKLMKSSGSDCSCAGWINRDLGDQGESSSGNGGSDNVVKFDNNEPDHVYQEFAVEPNADYTITIVTSFKPIANPPGSFPGSMLDLRILAGSGYTGGYTPAYYTDTAVMPQGNSATGLWGYNSVAQMENAANNLTVETISNPGNDDYNSNSYVFNSGANTSVALFIRGVGGDPAVGNYGYNSGDEEVRADSVTIIANN